MFPLPSVLCLPTNWHQARYFTQIQSALVWGGGDAIGPDGAGRLDWSRDTLPAFTALTSSSSTSHFFLFLFPTYQTSDKNRNFDFQIDQAELDIDSERVAGDLHRYNKSDFYWRVLGWFNIMQNRTETTNDKITGAQRGSSSWFASSSNRNISRKYFHYMYLEWLVLFTRRMKALVVLPSFLVWSKCLVFFMSVWRVHAFMHQIYWLLYFSISSCAQLCLLGPPWLWIITPELQSAKSAHFQSGSSYTAAPSFWSIQMNHMSHLQITLCSLEKIPEAFCFLPPVGYVIHYGLDGGNYGMPPGRELDDRW